MADRDDPVRGGNPANTGQFSHDGGGGSDKAAEKKDLERGKQAVWKAVGERLSGKQIITLQRLRESKIVPVEHTTGELPKGKTEAEHHELAKEVIAQHEKGIESEKDDLRKIVPAGAEVEGRVKGPKSILGKLRLKGDHYPDAKALGDVTGMRVVADSVKDARQTIKNVEKEYGAFPVDTGRKTEEGKPIYEPVPGSRVLEFDDKFNKAQGNYRSFHLTVLTKDGLKAELQIRTKNQHAMADWEHNRYKPQNEAQQYLADAPHVKEYAKKMADYFWDKDNGHDPGPMPQASEDIKLVYGTPGASAGYPRKFGKVTLPGR
jgi:ppGpp synthetase/RelA/SpoT-type nucleotidyltranferase